MTGSSVEDPPLAISIARLLREFPGYTASTLLEEDVDLIADLSQVLNAEVLVRKALSGLHK